VAFALDLAAKDLDLAIDLAEDVGADMSQLMTNRDVVAAAIRAHLGAADLSVIAEHLRT
jgi:3-hydroxyisobutyrate dehydrogenase-like beta-hydroxyacid dehydrogenase